jgi:hypothetical protein
MLTGPICLRPDDVEQSLTRLKALDQVRIPGSGPVRLA